MWNAMFTVAELVVGWWKGGETQQGPALASSWHPNELQLPTVEKMVNTWHPLWESSHLSHDDTFQFPAPSRHLPQNPDAQLSSLDHPAAYKNRGSRHLEPEKVTQREMPRSLETSRHDEKFIVLKARERYIEATMEAREL